MSKGKLTCDAFVHKPNLAHRICGEPATGIHHGIGGDQPRCDRHAIPGMERIVPDPCSRGRSMSLRTHTLDECVPPCPIHAPSDHHMIEWPLVWRPDKHLFERTCPEHGIGHPDPDSLLRAPEGAGVHGCCGCCRKPREDNE